MNAMTLLPCPFCGGEPEIVRAQDEDGRFAAVGCPHCGAGSRQHYFVGDDAVPHVVSAWNRRAHLAQPAQAVDVVAWRWRDNVRPGLPWDVTDDEDVINGMRRTGGYEIEPLTRAISGEKSGPVDGWRPIETAPKDGRSLILCRQTAFVGSWDADERAWCDNRRSLRDPSHWMPLPASPAPDKEGQP